MAVLDVDEVEAGVARRARRRRRSRRRASSSSSSVRTWIGRVARAVEQRVVVGDPRRAVSARPAAGVGELQPDDLVRRRSRPRSSASCVDRRDRSMHELVRVGAAVGPRPRPPRPTPARRRSRRTAASAGARGRWAGRRRSPSQPSIGRTANRLPSTVRPPSTSNGAASTSRVDRVVERQRRRRARRGGRGSASAVVEPLDLGSPRHEHRLERSTMSASTLASPSGRRGAPGGRGVARRPSPAARRNMRGVVAVGGHRRPEGEAGRGTAAGRSARGSAGSPAAHTRSRRANASGANVDRPSR